MSLRMRLVAGLMMLTALGLLVTSVSGVVLLKVYLYDRAGTQVGSFPVAGPAGSPVGSAAVSRLCAVPQAPDSALPSDFVLTLVATDGTVVCSRPTSTPGTPQPDLTAIAGASIDSFVNQTTTVGSTNGGSTQWRVRVAALPGNQGFAIVAVSLADAQATLARMRNIAVLTSLITLGLVALGAWFVVTIGLRPLGEIEETAEDIAAGDLTRRVPVAKPGTEVGRLSAALNGMLTQIELAFAARSDSEARLRRFVADASHELRTPLTTIRGHAAMYELGAASTPDDIARVMSRIESETARMGQLVDDMLLLARLDQDRPFEHEPVDVLGLVSDAVIDAHAVDLNRSIDLQITSSPGLEDIAPVVNGDEARLRQVTANLMSNALRHTPAGTPVHVAVAVRPDVVVLEVADEGPGMPPEVAARIFERFYRADEGRARSQGGSGLGLSIVDAIVRAHGGTVTCTSSEQGTTFAVNLPRESTN